MGKKWSAEHKRKFIATMAAKRKQRIAGSTGVGANHHDAVIYLRHAEREINKQLKSGSIRKLDSAQLYTLLALNALQGKS